MTLTFKKQVSMPQQGDFFRLFLPLQSLPKSTYPSLKKGLFLILSAPGESHFYMVRGKKRNFLFFPAAAKEVFRRKLNLTKRWNFTSKKRGRVWPKKPFCLIFLSTAVFFEGCSEQMGNPFESRKGSRREGKVTFDFFARIEQF